MLPSGSKFKIPYTRVYEFFPLPFPNSGPQKKKKISIFCLINFLSHSSRDLPILFNPENFTANGIYDTNLKELISYFSYEALYPTGFALGSKGTHDTERAYGPTLCSVGVSALVCAACISDATNYILQHCSYSKVAIMLYENCLYKYSDKQAFLWSSS